MADADHSRGTRLLALALQAREQGRIDDAERFTQLATQAFDRAAPATPPHWPAGEPSRSIAQQQQQPQPSDSDAAEPRGQFGESKQDGDRKT